MASILKTIAQDLNRSLLHGARQADEGGQVLPSTILDGRQAVTTIPQLHKGVAVTLEVDGAPIRTDLVPPAGEIDPVNAAVRQALENPAQYFKLEAEKQLPTWIFQQRLFSLPDRPAAENQVFYKHETTGAEVKLLRLPPAVLHENATHKQGADDPRPGPAPVTLCRVWQETMGNATYQKLEPLPPGEWQAAILVRCPMNPAWGSGSTETPVFELKGVPQDERWYLDQLNLLPPMSDNGNLPKEARLKIWVETPAPEGQDAERLEFKEWVMARRNLTILARPGETVLQDDGPQPVDYPYAVTERDEVNTIRLLQMGSITNSGGYYFRPYSGENHSFPQGKYTLVVAILFPVRTAEGLPLSQELPLAANAAAFPVGKTRDEEGYDPKKPEEPSVVRFEGKQHLAIEPYTPMGCLSFAWRRRLPELTTADPKVELKPSTPVGFSRSIHLLDFEAKGADGEILSYYREKISWIEDATAPLGKIRTSEWVSEPCKGDSGQALSPVKRLNGQTNEADMPLPCIALDREPEPDPEKSAADPPVPELYFYRNTLRLAKEEDGFSHLARPAFASIRITAAYRDIFGNRLLPGQGEQDRKLFYTDALIPPGEWPGFTFRMFPSAAGEVTLEVAFVAPDIPEKDRLDTIRKLRRINAQLNGAANDVSVKLLDTAEVDSPFTFSPGTGGTLKAGLLGLLEKAIVWEKEPLPLAFTFDVAFNAVGGDGGRPCVFAPQVVIEREEPRFHPPFDDLLGKDPDFLKDSIRAQVLRCRHVIPLAANALKDDPKPMAGANLESVQGPSFRDVIIKFSLHLSSGFRTQAAGRRNRFNEHELWFVPDALFPTARADAPLFSTPRPLSTTLGAESFKTPDFLADGAAGHWENLPLKQTSVTRADYDLLGRRGFELLDQLAQPLDLTAKTFVKDRQGNVTSELLWNAILGSKDQVASTLGDSSNHFVVPVFDKTPFMEGGVTRMCKDAFQRDLRMFYSIDALVQWPVDIPAVLHTRKPVINFYGVTTADIRHDVGNADNTRPTFSDFVLNPAGDLDRSPGDGPAGKGYLTVTYDLPPGGEKTFDAWTTTAFAGRITHLQLPASDDIESQVFNQGQWLELVEAGIPGDKAQHLSYTPENLKIPAVLRRFPTEPMMPSCVALHPPDGAVEPEYLGVWGWEVMVGAEANSNDTIYLAVEYSDPEKPPSADLAEDSVGWPSTNLLQDLVVLGQLANQPLSWWNDMAGNGPVALQAFPPLLRALNRHLLPKAAALADDAKPLVTDHFSCAINEISTNPLLLKGDSNPNRKRVVARTDTAEPLPPPGMTHFSVRAEADGVAENGILNLFVGESVTAFRPNLRLKRNASILGRVPTPSLVYECGPVYYPELLRVANRFSKPVRAANIPRDTFSETTLAAAIQNLLERVLGTQLGAYYDLRVDCKHSFTVGGNALTNAFLILPTDYKYTTAEILAKDLAKRYVDFLGSHAREMIQAITSPMFVLGLQATSRKDARPVLLEIDALEFAFLP